MPRPAKAKNEYTATFRAPKELGKAVNQLKYWKPGATKNAIYVEAFRQYIAQEKKSHPEYFKPIPGELSA